MSHIHITDKKTNFGRINKFYIKNNQLLWNEGRKTRVLKPINKQVSGQTSLAQRRGYSKDISKGIQNFQASNIDFGYKKSDSVYANSSASTQISNGYGKMKSKFWKLSLEGLFLLVKTRVSFKDSNFKNSQLHIIKDKPEGNFKSKNYQRKTTMEVKRLGNIRINKILK